MNVPSVGDRVPCGFHSFVPKLNFIRQAIVVGHFVHVIQDLLLTSITPTPVWIHVKGVTEK